MKILFDFDDVLLDTKSHKESIFNGLQSYGITSNELKNLYTKHQDTFSIKSLYDDALKQNGIDVDDGHINAIVDSYLEELNSLLDPSLLDIIHTVGKEQCYIITQASNHEHQQRKLHASGITSHIDKARIYIVDDNKNDIIKQITNKSPNETVVYLDDKPENIKRARMLEISNLIPYVYTEESKEEICKELYRLYAAEQASALTRS